MNTAEAVIGHWPEIFAHYKLPPVTGKNHFKGKCPICGRKGKFRIDNQNGRGTFICSCGNAGDGWALLRLTQGKEFKVLADEIDQLLGIQREKVIPKPKVSTVADKRQKMIAHYSRMPELKGTSAEKYLQRRGIYSHHPIEQIRFCEKQPTYKGDYQAMWALATDARGQLCYLHRTYLDGEKKAPLEVTRKMMSLQEETYLDHAQSVAIRLFPVNSTLGIAEGIETALSCKQIYKVNTWSTMNAGHMAKFIAPRGVKHLIIFADNDWSATGEAAAYACANKNLLANNDIEKVSVRYPDLGDFNDLLQQGCQAREREFVKKQQETA
ncbi:DNA primase [Xenorhabdus hominickii]|uniref:DNA primase n=1 Tax=Xenorhabdus hominickii TaxID=351679 RepID=A0ABN4SCC9_XENHO|nr:DNA primase [Xenorhabdus hominickii]